MRSINPATNTLIKEYPEHTDSQVDQIIDDSHKAFLLWRKIDIEEKAQIFFRLADLLEKDKALHAKIITEEMGKVYTEAQTEIEKCVFTCRYYAEHAKLFIREEGVEAGYYKSYISYQPLGIILAVMPWNFPFWQVLRFAVPTLLVGNVCLLRHAFNVFGCALSIAELFESAGFPRHCLQALMISHEKVPYVIQDKRVQGVTLTGSTYAGSQVAKTAGAHIKKTVLELGGSDPYLILNDADLDSAVQLCVKSRMLNAGQTCIAAKRFIVQNEIFADFVERFTDQMKAMRFGDPFDTPTSIGPLATTRLRDNLHQQVEHSIRLGAKCILGGSIPNCAGAYYPPTILTEVSPGMPAFDEELFGPVASIIKAGSEKEAITLANKSNYGLGGAVFTKDLKKGESIARNEIESGCCFVNGYVVSDPRLPFGGIKQSGYGRELGLFGIKEFTNVKTIVVNE